MESATPRPTLADWPFSPRTALAPMEGVTHPWFRAMTAERGGVGLLCTEFVRISRAPLAPKALMREVVKHPGTPLSVQVMGNDPVKMAEAARVLSGEGADVIDVNMGCPVPRVVKKGVGSAMLKDPALAASVIAQMREATDGLLSAKIRAGFDDSAHVVEVARAVQDAGADFIAVHPRRRCDFYEGVADWRIIRTLVEALRIPVVGNGDVWYAADALRMREETGCAAVMIGRPAIRNPFMFAQIADLEAGREPLWPDGEQVVAYVREVRERYESEARKSRRGAVVGKLKELVRYVARVDPERASWQRDALRAQDAEAVMSAVERGLSGRPREALDLHAEGLLGTERSGSAVLAGEAA